MIDKQGKMHSVPENSDKIYIFVHTYTKKNQGDAQKTKGAITQTNSSTLDGNDRSVQQNR